MKKTHRALVVPTTDYGTVSHKPPARQRNADVRAREYLTDAEVNRLITAAGDNRHGHRDATMILIAYRHGLRVSELVGLALGCDRLQSRSTARQSSQEWLSGCPSHFRP